LSIRLPIFPLALVVFPGENLNLHIFEPRYKQLINDCVSSGITFGIPSYIENQIGVTGTEVELTAIHRMYANGEMDVSVKANRIFEIKEIAEPDGDKLYHHAMVKWVSINHDSDDHLREEIVKLMKNLHETLKVAKNKIPLAQELKTFDIGHYIGLSLEQEYELLCKRKEIERLKYIYTHLVKILPVVRETEAMRERIQANGHFKHIQPPEF
jgi:Lon protease-like protein